MLIRKADMKVVVVMVMMSPSLLTLVQNLDV